MTTSNTGSMLTQVELPRSNLFGVVIQHLFKAFNTGRGAPQRMAELKGICFFFYQRIKQWEKETGYELVQAKDETKQEEEKKETE